MSRSATDPSLPAADELTPAAAAAVFDRARTAAERLRAIGIRDRLRAIRALEEVILRRKEEIVGRIVREVGKCRTDALVSEIFSVLDHLAYLRKRAPRILADRATSTPLALLGKSSRVCFDPLGTVLIISPWNYPFYQAIVPITSAFAPGNSTVYKPSEHTPLRGLVEDLLEAAGWQRDWAQVVYGDGAVAERLIHQRPDKIFFTGSVRTGKRIMAQAAPLLIPLELELGGKDPLIVFEDANLERAVAGALWGGLTNTGQSCTSVEFIYVQESIYDRFREMLVAQAQKLRQSADGGSPDLELGGMTTDFQADIVRDQIHDAVAKGARLLAGGAGEPSTRLVPPVVIEKIRPDMKLWTDETFGPVLPLLSFRDEAEVVRVTNASPFGLSASVWTADRTRAERVARALTTGNVSINNVMLTEGNPALPFGGVKQSGFGRYKGEFGLYSFSNIKSIIVDRNSSKIEANWYPYTARKYELFSRLIESLFERGPLRFVKFALTGIELESYAKKAHLDRS